MTRMTFWKKRNTMCGQIKNVLCVCGKVDAFIKTQLLNIFCSSLYGSVVWNLNHVCIAEVCVALHKGFRRVWGLPVDTHCELLPVICYSGAFLDVVFCRTTYFISCFLNIFSEIVNYVTRHGVFFSRMRSPIGSNALHCCQRYGARANDISISNSGLINRYVRYRYSDELISRASALLELIFIRDHSFNLSGWHIHEINYICCPLYSENE